MLPPTSILTSDLIPGRDCRCCGSRSLEDWTPRTGSHLELLKQYQHYRLACPCWSLLMLLMIQKYLITIFKKMLTFTDLNLRILNKILRDLYGQFYALHLEELYITSGLEGSSFLPHLALEEELLVPRHPVEGLAGPHLGPVHVAPDPGGRSLDVAQRHAHAHSRSRHVTISVSPGLGVVFTLLLFSNEAEAQNRILCSSSSSYLSICHMKQVK